VVASYPRYANAAKAVRRLCFDGLPIEAISVIGRNLDTAEGIGIYLPADTGAEEDRQIAAFRRMLEGAFDEASVPIGCYSLPRVGSVLVIGPLAEQIGRASETPAVALFNGLTAVGMPDEQAPKLQERLKSGYLLVIFHGSAAEAERAHYLLRGTAHAHLQMYSA